MAMTAEEYRARARACYKEKEDSFARCDTDGFLSQWASGATAMLCNAKADILDAGGKAQFEGLYEIETGRRVMAKCGYNTFNGHVSFYWLLHESEVDLIEKRGKKFLPNNRNSRILKSLGLEMRYELDEAWAKHGEGYSGHPVIYRSGDKWGATAEPIIEEAA